MLIVGFAGEFAGAGLGGDEFNFADQRAAPGAVDAVADLSVHRLELLQPGFGVHGEFKARVLAVDGACMRGKGTSDDIWPRCLQPREGRFGTAEPTGDFAENLSGAFHRCGILA